MRNVSIIGVGNIGTRHLQALALSPEPLYIDAVAQSDATLAKAKDLFESVQPCAKHVVNYTKNIDEIAQTQDIVIVATNSVPRRGIIEALLSQKKIKYFILEKFLFPRVVDYEDIRLLLEAYGVKAWVNHFCRMCEGFQALRQQLSNSEKWSMSVAGSRWGIGCNAVHYLDLISYLGGSVSSTGIFTDLLDSQMIDSKRSGYKEFTGTLYGTAGKCAHYSFTSNDSSNISPAVILISTENCHYVISPNLDKIIVSERSRNWECRTENFHAPFQSRLTHLAVAQILKTGTCNLTAYQESMQTHLIVLNTFLKHMDTNNIDSDFCPIT